jgi:hypothetical protein
MVKKKKERCCQNGSAVVGHLFALAGMYVLTGGLIGSLAMGDVFKSPVLWGLLLLGMSVCSMAASRKAK